jgi:hypothetical protein
MGRGLVEPLDDIRDTNPPSNPELLAALTRDFRDSGFDQKALLRRIANSRVYQLAPEPAAGNPPDDTFYTFYSPKRLMAEQLLQAIDDTTGVPDQFAGLPKGWRPIQLPDPEQPSYFLDTFGRSRRLVACECSRSDEVNITQALHLMNGDYLEKKLSAPSGRVAKLAAQGVSEEVVSNLYYAALSRPPSTEELDKSTGILKSKLTPDSQRKALEDLLWVLLNSREFMFNH